MNLLDLQKKKKKELLDLLKTYKISAVFNNTMMVKSNIIALICFNLLLSGNLLLTSGFVEILPTGFAFLRSSARSYLPGPDDVYITPKQIKKYFLRFGDFVVCSIDLPTTFCRYFSLVRVFKLNGNLFNYSKKRNFFSNLTSIQPCVHMKLELVDTPHTCYTTRIIDLISPIGFGQRVLLVSPPKTGKTLMLQNIAFSINKNYKNIKIFILLIDERPEEVTEMRRIVCGTIIASTFDESALRHIHVANMTLEHAKRIVETFGNVVILLDSITRLARAFNNVIPVSGKVLTGGIDSTCLQKPKRFFGAARFVKEGGSLTIIATALIDTGSKMDDIIFEEFKGTGNSEIFLDRIIADKRIYPAVNILKSGTRRDDLLLSITSLNKIWELRKLFCSMGSGSAIEFLLEQLKKFQTNEYFLRSLH